MSKRFDQVCRSIIATKFFTSGWGHPENLKQLFAFRKILSKRETCMPLIDKNHPITITKESRSGNTVILEAEFVSPLVDHLPGFIPKESEKACFQMVLPVNWTGSLKPVCLHLAGTGDHGYWRRRMLTCKPLLQESGIGSIILENPFYGSRKPKDQKRSSLRNVSDLFVMGGCLVMESVAIFHWCEKQGFGPLGISGISMGGHMASLAACIWDKPISLIPCLSWSTASGVFTQGVLSGAIDWQKLKSQYFSDPVFRNELFNMIQSPEGHFRVFHEAGRELARNFPDSLEQVKKLQRKEKEDNFIGKSPLYLNPLTLIKKIPQISRSSNFKLDESMPVENRPVNATSGKPVVFEPYPKVKDSLTWEALQFMRGVMDECTHLGNFSRPVDPSLAVIVNALKDGYMPVDGLIPLTDIWPGSELRNINYGHITGYLFNQQVFRDAIKASFQKAIAKYYKPQENNKSDNQHKIQN